MFEPAKQNGLPWFKNTPLGVFVGCTACEKLVARYGLETYYHHGKGLESYLRSIQGSVESGSRVLSEFEATQQEAVDGYDRVVKALRAQGKEP